LWINHSHPCGPEHVHIDAGPAGMDVGPVRTDASCIRTDGKKLNKNKINSRPYAARICVDEVLPHADVVKTRPRIKLRPQGKSGQTRLSG
jgi:hypothetical protein